jgi:hypothetical protein
MAIPCGTLYHIQCYRAGAPFKTRLPDGKGLSFPSEADPSMFPNFICEACQVRAVLDRELRVTKEDVHLLRLERMRLLDTMNRLSEGSMRTYKYPIRRLQVFEARYGVSILRPSEILRPSTSSCIPLMWAQLDHTLSPGKQEGSTVKYSSSRVDRSAASAYFQWDLAMSRPEQAMTAGKGETCWVTEHVLPTEEMAYTHFSSGLKRRMGDVSVKSHALRFTHIHHLEQQFEAQFQSALTVAQQHTAAAAGSANMLFWLGWLRSVEGFSLTRADISITRPPHGPTKGLPEGVGVVEIRLLPETKTNSATIADVVVAYTCWSGFSLGKWLQRLLIFDPSDGIHLFSTPGQRRWTSHYFRSRHVWPHLELLRAQGDSSMAVFSDLPGQRVSDRIWAMHSYRRGANTFVQHLLPQAQARAATQAEIYEHGRWRLQQKKEDMAVHYRGWDVEQRICITQLCM